MTRLQAERLRRGLTQTTLAFHAKPLTASDISKFENRMARPYPRQAERLAAVLGLEPHELLIEVEGTVESRSRAHRCGGDEAA